MKKLYNSKKEILSTDKEEIQVVKHALYERDLEKLIKPYLEGTLIKSETFSDSSFEYSTSTAKRLLYFLIS